MRNNQFKHWGYALRNKKGRPAYLLIADLIASDIDSGVLCSRDKLPPLRELAEMLNLDYTTAARGYKEARSRGLIDSHRGTGTFIKGRAISVSLKGGTNIEMTMNSPPEPTGSELLSKLDEGFRELSGVKDFYTLLRYQDFGGTVQDKEAGKQLLTDIVHNSNSNQILVCPGIHSVLLALLTSLTSSGSSVCVQNLVYPGLKAIAAQLNISLYSIDSDNDGPLISSLEEMCKKERVSLIYLNPTLQNPTTRSISISRRKAIADIALRYSIPIIEDDAYGVLLDKKVPAIANFAPELTYYITGLSKYFGAGLRTAYLLVPSKLIAQRTSGTMRALCVMTSPITNRLATKWITDGTVDKMTDEIRRESHERYQLASQILGENRFVGNPSGFHIWISLPKDIEVNPSILAAYLRSKNVSVVSSAAFCTDNNPPPAMRMCLGGSQSRWECKEALSLLAKLFDDPIKLSSITL